MEGSKPDTSADRYDRTTMWLHWLSAALVLALWCLGETIDWFPRGDSRIYARSAHIVFGAALALILCWRIVWRATRGQRLPSAELGRLHALSTVLHFTLYALLIATVALGLGNAWMRGDNIFNWFTLPAFDPANRDLRHRIGDLHALLANWLLILASLHALAGLWHFFVAKDRVLARMGLG